MYSGGGGGFFGGCGGKMYGVRDAAETTGEQANKSPISHNRFICLFHAHRATAAMDMAAAMDTVAMDMVDAEARCTA